MRHLIDLVEGQEHFAYHVTPLRNLKAIAEHGLVPKRGARSKRLGEKAIGIYLFPDHESLTTALDQWLFDEFGEETRLALLKVRLPMNAQIDSEVAYEVRCYDVIPPENITVLSRDLGGEVGVPS
jgi:hypothetical protein